MKYKVGDIVKVTADKNCSHGNYPCARAQITRDEATDCGSGAHAYRYKCTGHSGRYCGTGENIACDKEFISLSSFDAVKIKGIDLKVMENVVMPAEKKSAIISVLKQSVNAKKIFEEWGLAETIEYGRGMSFLFHGGPGTGKTWAAKCIAKAMGLEMLVIDSSIIQTSEPGGAERAILAAFDEARSKNKLLMFDECDSLITVRSDVGMVMASEINMLLTQVEKFEGVLIMTTNRIESLDPALERRLSLILEFKNPDYEERMAIWNFLIPKKLPLHEKVKVEKLAKFELTGGQIKNALLGAARKAVGDEAKEVTNEHFILSIEQCMAAGGQMGTAARYNGKGRVKYREDVEIEKVDSDDIDVDIDVAKSSDLVKV